MIDDDQPELWRKWLPRVHRSLARPGDNVEVPGIDECRDLEACQAYWECLEYLFAVLMGLAMLAVLVSLVIGLIGMVKGGEFNKKYGNKLMRWRVGLQGVALALFVLALLAR